MQVNIVIIWGSNDELVNFKLFALHYLNAIHNWLMSYNEPLDFDVLGWVIFPESEIHDIPKFQTAWGISCNDIIIIESCSNSTDRIVLVMISVKCEYWLFLSSNVKVPKSNVLIGCHTQK